MVPDNRLQDSFCYEEIRPAKSAGLDVTLMLSSKLLIYYYS